MSEEAQGPAPVFELPDSILSMSEKQAAEYKAKWEDAIQKAETKVKTTATEPQHFPVPNLRNRWLCPNGHTLGVTKTTKVSRFKSSTLLVLFPLAVGDDELVSETMPVHQITEGIIGCTKCGASREWKRGK